MLLLDTVPQSTKRPYFGHQWVKTSDILLLSVSPVRCFLKSCLFYSCLTEQQMEGNPHSGGKDSNKNESSITRKAELGPTLSILQVMICILYYHSWQFFVCFAMKKINKFSACIFTFFQHVFLTGSIYPKYLFNSINGNEPELIF